MDAAVIRANGHAFGSKFDPFQLRARVNWPEAFRDPLPFIGRANRYRSMQCPWAAAVVFHLNDRFRLHLTG